MLSCTFKLVGNVAPKLSNLVEWLQLNTSYDVAEESAAFVRSKVSLSRERNNSDKTLKTSLMSKLFQEARSILSANLIQDKRQSPPGHWHFLPL